MWRSSSTPASSPQRTQLPHEPACGNGRVLFLRHKAGGEL